MGTLKDYIDDLNRRNAGRNQYSSDSFQRLQDAQRRFYEELNQYQNRQGQRKQTLEDVLNQLGKHPGAAAAFKPPKPVITDPATRLKEIDKELDIIRGVVPTPPGYKIDPRKAKALMTEQAELKKRLTNP